MKIWNDFANLRLAEIVTIHHLPQVPTFFPKIKSPNMHLKDLGSWFNIPTILHASAPSSYSHRVVTPSILYLLKFAIPKSLPRHPLHGLMRRWPPKVSFEYESKPAMPEGNERAWLPVPAILIFTRLASLSPKAIWSFFRPWTSKVVMFRFLDS